MRSVVEREGYTIAGGDMIANSERRSKAGKDGREGGKPVGGEGPAPPQVRARLFLGVVSTGSPSVSHELAERNGPQPSSPEGREKVVEGPEHRWRGRRERHDDHIAPVEQSGSAAAGGEAEAARDRKRSDGAP
jgi:hypothetical protein